MKLHTLNRKVHYWTSILVALPVLIIIGTVLLLQMKKQLTWVQPPELRGTGKASALPFAPSAGDLPQHPASASARLGGHQSH